ncbi:MAG TPA: CapA family protein [Anaeromyxobacteraceae bacterium]|nr:CapA family protein [Anaeromyxobacteraceae bacterium]
MKHLAPLSWILLLSACATARTVSPSPPAPTARVEEPPPPAPTPAAAPAPDTTPITIAAVGDVMLGSTFPDETGGRLPPNDGAHLLAELAPVLRRADLAFANLEGPLTEDGVSEKCARSKPGRCYAFRVPTRYGAHLEAAGFDLFSLANNHAMDFGEEGRASTIAVLDALGLAWSGPPGAVARASVRGRTVAMIAFATNWGANDLRDLETARALVEPLAAEADLVLVSFHGGAEGAAYQRVPVGPETFLGEDRGDLRTFAHAMIDAGADLVLGHGPHVVRGMEVYRERLVAYSLGNFATYGGFNLAGPNGLSLVLEATLAPDGRFLGGRIHPAKQDWPGGPKVDPTGAIVPLVRQLSIDDFGPAAVRVAEDGALAPPAAAPPQAAADAPRG